MLVASVISGSALAADLPSRKAAIAEPIAAPMFTWTGFYVGVNLGYASNVSNGNYGALQLPPPTSWNHTANWNNGGTGSGGGVIGGGQVGYNYQLMSNFVVGIEADIQASSLKSTGSALGPMPPSNANPGQQFTSVSTQTQLGWFGTLRGRAGFTIVPTFLVYATGGLAYGNVKQNLIANVLNMSGPSALLGGGYTSSTRFGWTAGGGVEWAFLPNWSAKFEYLYTDLGSSSATLAGSTPIGFYYDYPGARYFGGQNARTSFQTFRVGVNYRFGGSGVAPVVAKY